MFYDHLLGLYEKALPAELGWPDRLAVARQLGFDYVLTDAGETVSIPVELEILNEKNEVLARTAFRIPCERGKNTTVRGNFLTSDANGGIGIDPDYDGDLEVDLGEL